MGVSQTEGHSTLPSRSQRQVRLIALQSAEAMNFRLVLFQHFIQQHAQPVRAVVAQLQIGPRRLRQLIG